MNEYTGHGTNTGGLQMHSIGEDYPFIVVGTNFRSLRQRDRVVQDTRYYILDGSTGARWFFQGQDGPRTWASITSAHKAITNLKAGHTSFFYKEPTQ